MTHRPDLTQTEFAIDMGKSRAYVAGLENMNMRAPGWDVCQDIARVLAGQALRDGNWVDEAKPIGDPPDAAAVWHAAAPDKLRASEPEMWQWHREQVSAALDSRLSDDELELIESLRSLRSALGDLARAKARGFKGSEAGSLQSLTHNLTELAKRHVSEGAFDWWQVDWLVRLVMRQNPGRLELTVPHYLELARLSDTSTLTTPPVLQEGDARGEPDPSIQGLARDLVEFWDLRIQGDHFYMRPWAMFILAINTWTQRLQYGSEKRKATEAVLRGLFEADNGDDFWSLQAMREALARIPEADVDHGRDSGPGASSWR